ncbi:DUF2269 family protein [Aliikangiella maris]|uniref:DUF2269 domain-containing protein n=2 Tax=Aliikangiella maris TaxID=3162458 RepID=A0ABV2BR42_9GAMM
MEHYYLLKLIHIIAAVVTMGTGAGIAFFMLMAVRTQDKKIIRHTSRIVILADWIFTAPAVVIQLFTGLLLSELLQISWQSAWFITCISLFLFVGCCWIPVILIQYQLHKLSCLHDFRGDQSSFKQLFKYWIFLGVPAFIAMIILFYLMIFKPLPLH